MAHSHNSGLALIFFFFSILIMKEANRYMKILLVVFREKHFIWSNLIFLGHSLLFDWVWSKMSQATVTTGSLRSQHMISFMITTRFLNSQDMVRILKLSGHDFSGKHLCNGYCMDIM